MLGQFSLIYSSPESIYEIYRGRDHLQTLSRVSLSTLYQNPRARRFSGLPPSTAGASKPNPIAIFDNPNANDKEIW